MWRPGSTVRPQKRAASGSLKWPGGMAAEAKSTRLRLTRHRRSPWNTLSASCSKAEGPDAPEIVCPAAWSSDTGLSSVRRLGDSAGVQ
eukprot:3938910-Rhodomonas_salina.2